ncbi:FecR family protein [Sphingobacterium psychroaquaticum]|uniref:FecR family protein n=1 Tax=Sphingobacterium psychroaquaticum TaxID=561061 RepID=UPI00106C754B|nr:FecR family protein [Sphingobacterium psychroaquaticum]QBQ40654.1 FecR family protein [Sphingobacterium psychroaquaticum]
MKNAKEILDRYNAGTATAEEIAIVESWYLKYKTPPSDLLVSDLLEEEEMGLQRLRAATAKKRHIRLWKPIAAAAILLLGVGWWALHKFDREPAAATEMLAGGESAILTLADGKKIALSTENIGKLLQDESVQIQQSAEGELVYTLSEKEQAHSPSSFNTIETPKGVQYKIVLPDRSVVYLSALSRLRYPVGFSKEERKVELTGQAHFEVSTIGAEGHKTPFVVQAGQQVIEVLGTQFNVCAYAGDGFIETALLEGKVKVSVKGSRKEVFLKPGQLARQDIGTQKLTVEEVDVNDLQAWKEGYFIFNNENIKDIMRKLSRWYGFEVEFVGPMNDISFQGNYQRTRDVRYLLKTLELSNNVHFEFIESKNERRVVVTRK